MLIDHAREKIGAADDFQAFEVKLHDHLIMQDQQFGEHLIRVQVGTRIGESAGGLHEAENIVHRIEGWMIYRLGSFSALA
jgi:hypothetical protein